MRGIAVGCVAVILAMPAHGQEPGLLPFPRPVAEEPGDLIPAQFTRPREWQ
jgi:hypothetical protein